jgi:hypothetical protein
MKRILIVSGVTILSLYSCTKDYNCSCNFGGQIGTINQDYTDVTRSEAEALKTACETDSACIWSVE